MAKDFFLFAELGPEPRAFVLSYIHTPILIFTLECHVVSCVSLNQEAQGSMPEG